MSLIKCPECGAVISSTVESCPKCGYRFTGESMEKAINDALLNPPEINRTITKNDIKSAVKSSYNEIKQTEEEGTVFGGLLLGIFLGLLGLIIGLCCKPKTKAGAVSGFFAQLTIALILYLFS